MKGERMTPEPLNQLERVAAHELAAGDERSVA
jgi:hypothetical protein